MLGSLCKGIAVWSGYLLYSLVVLVALLWLLFPRTALQQALVGSLEDAYPQLSWQVQTLDLKIFEGFIVEGIEGVDREKKSARVHVNSIVVRPDFAGMLKAWRPRVAYRVALAQGTLAGAVEMDGIVKPLRFDGTAQGVQLAAYPVLEQVLGRGVRGVLAASFHGRVRPLGKEFSELEAKVSIDKGDVGLKQPLLAHMTIPFDRLEAKLFVDGAHTIRCEEGKIYSELFQGQFSGPIQLERETMSSQLDIAGTLLPKPALFKGFNNASILKVMRSQTKDNTVPFRISGELNNPGIHFEEFSLLFQSLEKESK